MKESTITKVSVPSRFPPAGKPLVSELQEFFDAPVVTKLPKVK